MGCTTSRNKIIEKYSHITEKVALRYTGVANDIKDLEQEGILGLFQAIDAYDEEHNCSFETYATRRVFTVIDEYVLKNKHIHSIPLYVLKKLRSMKNRVETNADERHYDKNLCLSDFDSEEVSIISSGESHGVTEDYLSSILIEQESDENHDEHMVDFAKKVLCEHEGGKFLLLNTLLGESVKWIAETYDKEPYYVSKKMKQCISTVSASLD